MTSARARVIRHFSLQGLRTPNHSPLSTNHCPSEFSISIKQKRTLTEKSAAAHRENAQKSRGPVTPEGRQMQRDASLRHGFYSKDRDKALRALGEDPADFDTRSEEHTSELQS